MIIKIVVAQPCPFAQFIQLDEMTDYPIGLISIIKAVNISNPSVKDLYSSVGVLVVEYDVFGVIIDAYNQRVIYEIQMRKLLRRGIINDHAKVGIIHSANRSFRFERKRL